MTDFWELQTRTKRICINCRETCWTCRDRIFWTHLNWLFIDELMSCSMFNSKWTDQRIANAIKEITWMKERLCFIELQLKGD